MKCCSIGLRYTQASYVYNRQTRCLSHYLGYVRFQFWQREKNKKDISPQTVYTECLSLSNQTKATAALFQFQLRRTNRSYCCCVVI